MDLCDEEATETFETPNRKLDIKHFKGIAKRSVIAAN